MERRGRCRWPGRSSGPRSTTTSRTSRRPGRCTRRTARGRRRRSARCRPASAAGSPRCTLVASNGRPDRAAATGDRVGEPGVDADVGPLDGRVGQQVDARAVDDRVAMGARERQRAVGEFSRERPLMSPKPGEIVRVEVDDEPVRDECPVRGRQPFRLHRALDPPLELDRLESGPEEPSRRALEESFEEPLDGGERRHGRSRRYQRVLWRPPARCRPHRTIRRGGRYPRWRGRPVPCDILSPLFGVVRPPQHVRAHPGTR